MLLNMTKRMTGTMWQQLQECASSLSACKNDLVGCKGKKGCLMSGFVGSANILVMSAIQIP